MLTRRVQRIGVLLVFHPAQYNVSAGHGKRGPWHTQWRMCVGARSKEGVRTEGGWRAGAAHGIAGRERDQAPVYTVEATDLLLLVCPVPGRVPAVGGRGSAIPAFRGSSEPCRARVATGQARALIAKGP